MEEEADLQEEFLAHHQEVAKLALGVEVEALKLLKSYSSETNDQTK